MPIGAMRVSCNILIKGHFRIKSARREAVAMAISLGQLLDDYGILLNEAYELSQGRKDMDSAIELILTQCGRCPTWPLDRKAVIQICYLIYEAYIHSNLVFHDLMKSLVCDADKTWKWVGDNISTTSHTRVSNRLLDRVRRIGNWKNISISNQNDEQKYVNALQIFGSTNGNLLRHISKAAQYGTLSTADTEAVRLLLTFLSRGDVSRPLNSLQDVLPEMRRKSSSRDFEQVCLGVNYMIKKIGDAAQTQSCISISESNIVSIAKTDEEPTERLKGDIKRAIVNTSHIIRLAQQSAKRASERASKPASKKEQAEYLKGLSRDFRLLQLTR